MSEGLGWKVRTRVLRKFDRIAPRRAQGRRAQRSMLPAGPAPGKAPAPRTWDFRPGTVGTVSTPGPTELAARTRGRRRPGARGAPRRRARPDRRHGAPGPRRRLRGPQPRRLGPVPRARPAPTASGGQTATRCSTSGGADPLADRSTDRFTPARRRARPPVPAPPRERLPVRASTTIAQLFDHPAAPDLCVLHSAAHNWEDQGGHRGEHGSLGIVQARAPFVLAGKGVAPTARPRGRPGSSTSRRPSLELLGLPTRRRRHAPRRPGRRGAPRRRSIPSAGRPRHVVAFLFDGTNSNVLYDMAAPRRGAERRPARRDGHRVRARRDGGPADHHARQPHLGDDRPPPRATTASSTTRGSTVAPASRSSRTPTTPGRGRCSTSRPGSSRSTRCCAAPSLTPSPPRSTSRATSAPATRPSTSSAAVTSRPIPKSPDGLPHTTERFVRPYKDYRWSSVVDHMGIDQAVGIWSGQLPGHDLPAAAVHVLQLHADRLRDARRRPVLRDRRGVDPRLRRPPRRDPRRDRTGRGVRRHRVRARRRPRHGGERPRPSPATGT